MAEGQISAAAFAAEGRAATERAVAANKDSVATAGRLFADCVAADGVVHGFGTGHSQATVLEIVGRAGGLIPTNRIGLADLVLRGDEDRSYWTTPSSNAPPGSPAGSTTWPGRTRRTSSSSCPTPASTTRSSTWPCTSRRPATSWSL